MKIPQAKRQKIELPPNGDSFRKMRLRTVIKENHGSSITKVEFNKLLPSTVTSSSTTSLNVLNCTNLVACIGSNELNIYDNFHCGKNFLDLFCNFVHKIPKKNPRDLPADEERHTPGAKLTCLTWISKPSPEHTNLAVGTEDGEILILSLASSRVTHILKGHTSAITTVMPVQVTSTTGDQGLLSSSRDGTVKLWNTTTGQCVTTYNVVDGGLAKVCESIKLMVETENSFLTSHPDGSIRRWLLDYKRFNDAVDACKSLPSASSFSSSSKKSKKKTFTTDNNDQNTHSLDESTYVFSSPKGRAISHFVAGKNGTILTCSNTGRVSIWKKGEKNIYTSTTTFTVPRGIDEFSTKSKSDSGSNKRAYSVATFKEFVVVGNEGGEIIVYSSITGSQVATLSHSRMNSRAGNITNLDVSVDGSTILASTSSGLLFRWSSKPVWDGEIFSDDEKV
jgi:WD40 repeat protein